MAQEPLHRSTFLGGQKKTHPNREGFFASAFAGDSDPEAANVGPAQQSAQLNSRHVATKGITLFFCWCEAYIWVLQTHTCVGGLQSHKNGEAFTSRRRGRLDGRCLADLHSTRRAWAAIASHTAQPHGGLSVERHSRRTGHSLLHNANSDIPIDTKNGRGGALLDTRGSCEASGIPKKNQAAQHLSIPSVPH